MIAASFPSPQTVHRSASHFLDSLQAKVTKPCNSQRRRHTSWLYLFLWEISRSLNLALSDPAALQSHSAKRPVITSTISSVNWIKTPAASLNSPPCWRLWQKFFQLITSWRSANKNIIAQTSKKTDNEANFSSHFLKTANRFYLQNPNCFLTPLTPPCCSYCSYIWSGSGVWRFFFFF